MGFHGRAYRLHGRHTNPWLILLGLALAAAAAATVLAIIVALLAVISTAALLIGGAWVAWKATTALRAGAPSRRADRRLMRESRGLLEIASTVDPMERYLLAVREFERISMAALEIDPQEAGSRRAARRAGDLYEQAANLADAVAEVERALVRDPHAEGARAHVWELSIAARDLTGYLEDVAVVRGTPSLAVLRRLVAHRTTLAARRTTLVDRLDAADVTRSLPSI